MSTKSKYNVISKFELGYRNKEDVTNLPPGVLVVGSQNMTLNDGERVATRLGYTLDGEANAALFGIASSYDWLTHIGTERHLRSYDDELEYRYVDSAGTVTWRRLANGFTSPDFNYAEYWNSADLSDELLMVNGSSNIYSWSGGLATFASATVNTITKQGVTTWAEENFYLTGTRSVVIGGTTYTYTGGEGTTTLTGVAPDPTVAAHAVGSIIHQGLRTTANAAMAGIPAALENDLIGVLYNQIYIGSFKNRSVYVSKVNNYQDYTFATPRSVGEGAILTLDATPVGFVPQEDNMYITAGLDFWYQTTFQLSADNTDQSLTVNKLKTNAQAAAQSQAMISQIKNDVVFISNEPTLDTLGRVLGVVLTPQSSNISDPIKKDFDSYDFDSGSVFYYRNYIYITVPDQGIVRVFNLTKQFWEAPMILPISRFAIIDGLLYGHSSQVPETYKMFTGTNDNGVPISFRAVFSYENGGTRADLKVADEFYTEGYITSNSIITQTLRYDYEGHTGVKAFPIDGSDTVIIFNLTGDGSLGKQNLGNKNLAGRGDTEDVALPPKFRVIKTTSELDYYEIQTEYSSDAIDQYWEILGFGSDQALSTTNNAAITQ